MIRIVAFFSAWTLLLGACAGTASPSPPVLYFLDGPWDNAQVWRLDLEGLARSQITQEPGGVDAFDVSPADGSLAFVSDNALYTLDRDGGNRQLIADASQVDQAIEDYVFRGFIESPSFSPDGRTLAYAFDGLHLYDLASGEDQHVLTNLGNLLGEPFVFVKEVYAPGPWSPDGSKLLILMGYYEGSTMAVMEPGADPPFRRLWSDGPVCCLFDWTADSRAVLVANPTYTGVIPGLWRYDAGTGEESVVIQGLDEAGWSHFVGYPLQLASGELLFFHAHLERFSPDEGIPMGMTRSDPDGANPTQVRPEMFHISDVLWAQDGSYALILGRITEDRRQLFLARTDGSPLQVLIDDAQNIRHLKWGRRGLPFENSVSTLLPTSSNTPGTSIV